MGLFIVKGILDSVNGKIEIRNKPDKGLTVSIILQRHKLSMDDEYMEVKEYIPKTAIEKEIEIILLDEVYQKGRDTVFFIKDNKGLVSLLQKTMFDEFNFYYAFNGGGSVTENKIDL
jgi:hypothetical protein